MTLLQISEKIRDHLTNQKARSMNSIQQCMYREGGNMCAVGCLITDEVYSPELERKAMTREEIVAAVGLSLKMKLSAETIELLKAWQNYHDNGYSKYVDHELTFYAGYERWIEEGAEPDHTQSPAAMHEHLKSLEQYDMSGEITKRYIIQVSQHVADHLLKQGKQAVDSNGSCQYRSDNGCMCAVGVLIDPKLYDAGIEGVSLSSRSVATAVAKSLGIDSTALDYDAPMFKVLRAWQRYHDNRESSFSKEEISYKAREIELTLDDKYEFPDLKD